MPGAFLFVQARLGSTRLPGKVLEDVEGEPMLHRVVQRARAVPGVSRVAIVTTVQPPDREIVRMAEQAGVDVFAGSEEDVLDRFYQAACHFGARAIVRVTADCPLLDPALSGEVVQRLEQGDVDYVTNCRPPTLPDGLDTEAMRFEALERAWHEAALPSEREHVTPYIWKNADRFRIARLTYAPDRSAHRWTVDDLRDLSFVREVYRQLLPQHGPCFGMREVLDLLDQEPRLRTLNAGTLRNEGYARSVARDPKQHDVAG